MEINLSSFNATRQQQPTGPRGEKPGQAGPRGEAPGSGGDAAHPQDGPSSRLETLLEENKNGRQMSRLQDEQQGKIQAMMEQFQLNFSGR